MPVLIPVIAAAAAYAGTVAVLGTVIGAIGASIIGAAVAFGVSTLLSSALGLNRQPSYGAAGPGTAANPSQAVRQPVTSHKLVYGQMRVSGPITFLDVGGPNSLDNSLLTMVITISGRRAKAVDAILFGDTYVPRDASGNILHPTEQPDGTVPPDYAGKAYVVPGLGTNHGDVDFLTALTAWSARWTGDCKQYGRAKLGVKLVWDRNVFGGTGIPNVSAIVRGRMPYDSRDAGVAITSSNTASPSVFTANGHGLAVGDSCYIRNHSGAQFNFNGNTVSVAGEYEVATVPSANTLTLYGPDFLPLVLTVGGNGGTITKMDWTDNAALLPSDYLCDPVYGLGAKFDEEIPETQLESAANSCDEMVTRATPSTTFTVDTGTDLLTLATGGTAGVAIGDLSQVTVSTSGSLPSPLAANTVYYTRIGPQPNQVYLSATLADAQDGVHINITTTGTGTQTVSLVTTFTADATEDTLTLFDGSLRIITGTRVQVASTVALPTGLSAATNYFAILFAPNILRLATSLANARAGAYINLSSAGSGDMTITVNAEPRYTVNGLVDSSAERMANIQSMMTACGGYLVPNGVTLSIFPAVYNTPAVTLTDSDLRGPVKFDLLQSVQVTFNSVKGMFYDPFASYQPTDMPTYQDTGYVSDDRGEVIWGDYPLPFTNSAGMGLRLFKINLERVRRERSFTMPCKLTPFRIGAADVIMVTNGLWGLSSSTYEVRTWRFSSYRDDNGNQALGVDLSLRETDASVFSWSSSDERLGRPTITAPALIMPAALSQIMIRLGLTTNLKVALDAGDSQSYAGSGSTWADTSQEQTDFVVGSPAPVFVGNAGALSASDYWNAPSGGEYFEIDAVANPAWLQAFHKNGGTFTIFAVVYGATGGPSLPIFSDIDSTGAISGISMALYGNALDLTIAGNDTGLSVAGNFEGWNFVAVSYNDGDGSLGYAINGTTGSGAVGTNTSSTDAPDLVRIGYDRYLGGAHGLPIDSRVELVGVMAEYATAGKLIQIYQEIRKIRPDLELP